MGKILHYFLIGEVISVCIPKISSVEVKKLLSRVEFVEDMWYVVAEDMWYVVAEDM